MSHLLNFIDQVGSPKQKQILQLCHSWLTEEMKLTHKMRYGIPFYDDKKWICYLNPLKKDGIEFAFINGFKISDDKGLLKDKGRKMVRGLDLFNPKSIPFEALELYVLESIKHQKKN